jgi:hypothetical protein
MGRQHLHKKSQDTAPLEFGDNRFKFRNAIRKALLKYKRKCRTCGEIGACIDDEEQKYNRYIAKIKNKIEIRTWSMNVYPDFNLEKSIAFWKGAGLPFFD